MKKKNGKQNFLDRFLKAHGVPEKELRETGEIIYQAFKFLAEGIDEPVEIAAAVSKGLGFFLRMGV